MKKFTFLFIIIFSISLQLKAQETIDLNTAINTAIRNNTNISQLEKSLQIQELSTSTARGSLYPVLSMSGSWSRNNTFSNGTVRFQNGVPIVIPKQNTWINNFNLGLSSSVTLFNGFANYEQVDFERQNEASLRIQVDKQKYDVVYNTNTAFFNVLKKEKIVASDEETLSDSRSQLERVKEFMNVGKKTIADIYRQDVQVAQNELAVEQASNDFKKSKIDLLLAINTDLNKEFTVSESNINTNLSDADFKEILNRNSNTEALTSQALVKRFDYKVTQQDIRIKQVQYDIDKKNLYYPSVSAFSNYNLNSAQIQNLQDTRSWSFGLTLSYSIFQGSSLSNKTQASQILILQKEDDLRQLQQQIRSDIKKSYIDLETQYKQIEILNRNIVSAEQDKTLSEENYRVGLGTLLDAQTAATKLNVLKISLINAYYDFLLAERRIRYYSGDLNY